MTHDFILGIDPGPHQSACVWYEPSSKNVLQFILAPNADVIDSLQHHAGSGLLAIEMIASYGMPVGADVFNTCVEIGKMIQAWQDRHVKVFRSEVKLHICQSMRANDATIRQALIDRYGGKELAIGLKKTPGPLYGMKGDIWSALAVAITAAEQ